MWRVVIALMIALWLYGCATEAELKSQRNAEFAEWFSGSSAQ